MNLYLRAPMFTREGRSTLEGRVKNFQRWVDSNRTDLKRSFSIDTLSFEAILPSLSYQLTGNVSVTFPQPHDALVPKALCIRLELLAVLDEIDCRDAEGRRNSYFVQVDGSGAFEFDSTYSILTELVKRTNCVVLGQRDSQSDWGMTPERKRIELFENSLLEHRYSDDLRIKIGSPLLPDAQAGCWGLRLDALQDISLTAHNYGLEFDLIASTLQAGIPFGFVGVHLASSRSPSNFRTADSIEKFRFIRQKLGYSTSEILQYLNSYVEAYGETAERKLPEVYLEQVRKILPKQRSQPAV